VGLVGRRGDGAKDLLHGTGGAVDGTGMDGVVDGTGTTWGRRVVIPNT
jgi:hypothetical protein